MKNYLNEMFYYDESDINQILRYKVNHRGLRKGDKAGCVRNGCVLRNNYSQIKIKGKTEKLHRVVWIYFNGDISGNLVVDHINGNIKDNRIANLQLVTREDNKKLGSPEKYKNNTSGVTGVVKCSATGKWKVSFRKSGILYYFGVHESLDVAKQICKAERSRLYSESRR